jgi:hypothetical protein
LAITEAPIVHQIVIGIVSVHFPAELELLEIADAVGGKRPCFGSGQRRQKHGSKNGNDRDDDQQLDESESSSA